MVFTSCTHTFVKDCQLTARPSWIITPMNDSDCYYGINSAQFSGNQPNYDVKQKAKDRAIKDF